MKNIILLPLAFVCILISIDSASARAEFRNNYTLEKKQIIIMIDKRQAEKESVKIKGMHRAMGMHEKSRLHKNIATQVISKSGAGAGTPPKFIRRLATGALLYEIDASAPNDIEKIIKNIRENKIVKYADHNRLFKPQLIPNDNLFSGQWDKHEITGGIRADKAWNLATGKGVTVAVLDTGYRNHKDLTPNILPGYDFIDDPNVANDGNGRDANAGDPGDGFEDEFGIVPSSWHGTHVAGIIAAVANNDIGVAGVAYNAKILPVRVLGVGGGYTSDIIDGLVWAAGGQVEGVPVNEYPADVINMSLGGSGYCSAEQDAINIARTLGAVVVVAAGNDNSEVAWSSPANCDGVITVAASNPQGHRSYYSNTGELVDLAAPGGETDDTLANGILSTLNDGALKPGAQSYAYYQGTSMAAPQTAGVAALMLELDSALTPDQVECTLKSTARNFPDQSSCPGCGEGLLNAFTAAREVEAGRVVSNCESEAPDQKKIDQNSVLTASGDRSSQTYYKVTKIPKDTHVTVQTSGGMGDMDLYMSVGPNAPTLDFFDCVSWNNFSNSESCTLATRATGNDTARLMLHGYREYIDASLSVTLTPITYLTSGIPIRNLEAKSPEQLHYRFTHDSSQNNLKVIIRGNNGDADLYVYIRENRNSQLVCSGLTLESDETCNILNAEPGVYDIYIHAFDDFDELLVKATSY